MKFIQIAVASDADNGSLLYALGEDFNVYQRASRRHKEGEEYNGQSVTHRFWGAEFWLKIDGETVEPIIPARGCLAPLNLTQK